MAVRYRMGSYWLFHFPPGTISSQEARLEGFLASVLIRWWLVCQNTSDVLSVPFHLFLVSAHLMPSVTLITIELYLLHLVLCSPYTLFCSAKLFFLGLPVPWNTWTWFAYERHRHHKLSKGKVKIWGSSVHYKYVSHKLCDFGSQLTSGWLGFPVCKIGENRTQVSVCWGAERRGQGDGSEGEGLTVKTRWLELVPQPHIVWTSQHP